eukprot:CAMPEP_0170651920 /NCGR_PEP_ID=MMETSP0224-20130122/46626_1 /TAXON_ID=285029 /ORGANISM="Togula jolla, Strain CCCM 725" /LENGTH=105 /DNA_ID=CAMNT_0010983747 /DNA_START=85 /DNA_END=399 /DNA_ORIENTATION=-
MELPINVMSCRSFLALLGPTFPGRLWCVWELFTLFAFTRSEQALERICLKQLDEELCDQLLLKLSHFDVLLAECFNPNQQARLLRVIRALGCDLFNERIRLLARQ